MLEKATLATGLLAALDEELLLLLLLLLPHAAALRLSASAATIANDHRLAAIF
jgi:hypothetical protein